jgi:RHS repeat-associated protein
MPSHTDRLHKAGLLNLKRTLLRALVAAAALFVGTQAIAARTTTYYHNDGLGSVVAATNDAGQVLWRKDYAPFGEQIDTTPDTERQSYTGKSHDDVTGLTYFGGRYYDPQIARFMSVDPVGFVDNNTMSFNRYLYVNDNPYKYVDPDGEFLNFALKFAFDVAINVAFNYVTTGELNVGGALKESALGLLNPAKTLAKAGQLASFASKTKKVEKVAERAALGAAGGARAGKGHTRAANKLGRANNRAANNGSMVCPTCKKKMNEPVQSKRGEPIDRDAAVGDHKLPKSKGGDGATVRDMRNHETKCWECNSVKSDSMPMK